MILTSIKPSLIGFSEGFIFTPYMLLRYVHIVLLVLSLSSSVFAQNKWDLDSVYLAEFGKNSLLNKPLLDSGEIPSSTFLVRPLRPFFGIIDATAEIKLEPSMTMLVGFHHYSYIYRYGQPNDPSRSYLLNNYGSRIYEEWIFANIYSFDLRKYKSKKNKKGKQVLTYTSFLNRFSFQRWGYSLDNMVLNPFYYDGALQDLYGPAQWIPANPDNLLYETVRRYRPGIEFGRRMSSTRIIQPAYLKTKYFEYSLCLTLSYSPWNELLFPILMTNFSLVYF